MAILFMKLGQSPLTHLTSSLNGHARLCDH
jgi:hypothetical protein